MAIYDADGTQLFKLYDADGEELLSAYDADGSLIYTAQPLNLKVMTYNVGGWYTGVGTSVPSDYDQLYYDLQNGIIQQNSPDILCIEEYRDQFTTGGRTALSLLSQYFPYIRTNGGDTNYWGRAVCSKYPIQSYTEHFYANESQRYYGNAVINAKGRVLNVLVTHLSTDQAKREVQAGDLFRYCQTLTNVIACGDYNTTYARDTDPSSEWSAEYYSCYKQFVDAGYHLANCAEENGWFDTYWQNEKKVWRSLDNIITSSNIAIDEVYTDNTKKTDPITDDPNWKIDHIPLIAELTVTE